MSLGVFERRRWRLDLGKAIFGFVAIFVKIGIVEDVHNWMKHLLRIFANGNVFPVVRRSEWDHEENLIKSVSSLCAVFASLCVVRLCVSDSRSASVDVFVSLRFRALFVSAIALRVSL